MKRNLKALGLALFATFAMSAVVASAAQALTQGKFTQPQGLYPVVITGTEEGAVNHFTITSGANTTSCKSVRYEGTITEATTQVEITPHYTECTTTSAIGNLATTIHLNGCKFLFTAGTNTSSTDTHGSVHVKCPVGQKIEVTASPCSTDIGEQTLGGAAGEVTYTNLASGHVTADIAVKKIKYTETDLNFFCPNTNNHTTEDSEFTSNVTIAGFEDLGKHSDPGTPGATTNTYTEGVARSIDVR